MPLVCFYVCKVISLLQLMQFFETICSSLKSLNCLFQVPCLQRLSTLVQKEWYCCVRCWRDIWRRCFLPPSADSLPALPVLSSGQWGHRSTCVLRSLFPPLIRTILFLSAMSSRHWINRVAVDWLSRPNAWSIPVWTVRTALCSRQKGICALLCAAAAHAAVCNAFFSFSQGLWEEKARETLRSFTSWDFSCPLRSGETFFIFSGITSFSVPVPCVWRLVQRMEQSELTITPHLIGKREYPRQGSFWPWRGCKVIAQSHLQESQPYRRLIKKLSFYYQKIINW